MTAGAPKGNGFPGKIIPAEWVGLPRNAGGPLPGEVATAGAARQARLIAKSSVIASADSAVVELFAPVRPVMERGGCFVEPGKPCRGSGRCRQRGY